MGTSKAGRLKALVFTSLGHFTNDFTTLLFSILIIYYNKDFGLGLAFLGAVAIAYNIISGFLSTPIGRFADKTRQYPMLIAFGIIILGVSMVIFSFSFESSRYTVPIMGFAVIFLGIGQAFYHPLGASVLEEIYSEKSSLMMGINGSFGSIGRSLLPIVLIPLILVIGAPDALAVLGIYAIFSGIIIFFGLASMKRWGKKLKETEKKSDPKISIGKYKPVLILLTLLVFVRAMFLIGTTTYISEYLLTRVGSEITVGYILTISFVTAILGQPLFGRLTDKYGGKLTIAITTVFSTLTFIAFMLSGSDVLFLIISYASFVFLAFTGFPVLLGYVNQIIPSKITTTAHGIVWGLGNTVGGATGIAVMSILILEKISLTETMWAMVLFGIASIFFIPFIPGRKRLLMNHKSQ
jgi:MFS family permease